MTKNMEKAPDGIDIVRTAHVEFLVKDLERSRKFYVGALGFVETSRDGSRIYLRGFEDRFHHCLVLTKSKTPAVSHFSFRVRSEEDLDKLGSFFGKLGLKVKWLDKEEEEEGLGKALRIQDPFGFPVEFFKEMEEVEWLAQKFERHEKAKIMRIDHVNLLTPNIQGASDWYTQKLGFLCSEFTETEGRNPKLWATWLRRKPTVHDIALMNGIGPRFHHAGFSIGDKHHILECADSLASRGYVANLERGPGRHGISNAFFLYIRDPDGHRIELYSGDYLSADPDWKPLKWKLHNPQRQTFWGSPAPESWFSEASRVLSVYDGKPVSVKPSKRKM